MADLNGANDAAGHDGELPCDCAHSQFELRHVGSVGQNVGQAVGTRCKHKTNGEGSRETCDNCVFSVTSHHSLCLSTHSTALMTHYYCLQFTTVKQF